MAARVNGEQDDLATNRVSFYIFLKVASRIHCDMRGCIKKEVRHSLSGPAERWYSRVSFHVCLWIKLSCHLFCHFFAKIYQKMLDKQISI